nr:MAG TPA: hypothetical protein [Caudoviricetes sp.]
MLFQERAAQGAKFPYTLQHPIFYTLKCNL